MKRSLRYLKYDRFTQADIHELAPHLLDALLTKIESAETADKIAENEYLMRCARLVSLC